MSDTDIIPDAFDPRFLESAQRRQAAVSLINADEDDPEKAARAVELGNITGVPAPLIHGDQDNFEAQHKLSVNNKLKNDNAFLKEYITSHPMAASISHDDLGQLDAASQAMQTYGTDTGLAKWLKEDQISQSFMKGFGDQPIDTRRFYHGFSTKDEKQDGILVTKHDIDWAVHQNRLLAATAGAGAQVLGLGEVGLEGLSRVTAGLLRMGFDGMSTIFGESLARDFTAMVEVSMMRGDIGVRSLGGDVLVKGMEARGTAGPLARIKQNMKLFKDLNNALEIADHYTEGPYRGADLGPLQREPSVPISGPPPGVHPHIDTAIIEQAKKDGKALKDMLAESTKSATRDRSADYYSRFARINEAVGDREIGIDAEAVRALYGDKVPEVGDNILGWVPDLAGKLAAAEGIGGDIRVPLADYLARVDPEVHQELGDFIRTRDGGITLNELKIGKERAEEPAPVKEPEIPKAPSEDYPEEWFQDKSWKTDELRPLEGDAATYVNDPNVFQAPNGRLISVNPETGERLKTSLAGAGQGIKVGEGGTAIADRAPFQVTSVEDAEAAVKHLGKEGVEKARAEAVKAAGYGQKEVIADPLQLVRGSGGLEPQFSIGDRKVTLERKPITEGGLEGPIAADNFRLLDENGKKIGFLDVIPYKDGTHLYVDKVGGFERLGFGPNGFGPAVTRDIARQLKAAYPNATHIGGFRVTGAREKAGTVREVWTKFSQETPDGWEHAEAGQTLRELFAEIGGQSFDLSHGTTLH